MEAPGLRVPPRAIVESVGEAEAALAAGGLTLPAIVRPAFTLGGQGGGVAHTETELAQVVSEGLAASPINQVLVEESVLGWGEFELEVMRDHNDNVVIVCSIENVDPMGVHTGDSVTVAPQQTLTDRLYQQLRDQAIAVIRAVGVETGGSNVQFAVNPGDRRDRRDRDEPARLALLGARPRRRPASRSPRSPPSSRSATRSRRSPTTSPGRRRRASSRRSTTSSSSGRASPSRSSPAPSQRLTTHMKSVGEAMAIGRTFRESFAKAMRSRELDSEPELPGSDRRAAGRASRRPRRSLRPAMLEAFRAGRRGRGGPRARPRSTPGSCASCRRSRSTATAPRASSAPSRRSTPARPSSRPRRPTTTRPTSAPARATPARSAAASGPRSSSSASGPNRIGQGIEFDYCCVHAAMTVRESGRDAVMINCNPETVSTDYDTSDRLYFEPLTAEDVLAVIEVEQPEGVIVQFGGQTPLKLARALEEAGVPLLGTPVDAIDLAEDRGRFGALLRRLRDRPPALRHRALGRRGDGDRRAGRLPAARPALLRARRPGDGDLLSTPKT